MRWPRVDRSCTIPRPTLPPDACPPHSYHSLVGLSVAASQPLSRPANSAHLVTMGIIAALSPEWTKVTSMMVRMPEKQALACGQFRPVRESGPNIGVEDTGLPIPLRRRSRM
jgi:hypothetical protein